MQRRGRVRGLTLVEVLIVVALIGVLAGTVMLGPGLLRSSHVRAAATLMVSAVRLGTTRANATGKPARLVIDIDERRVLIEEASGSSFLREAGEVAAGADPASDAEKAARSESERILEGPRAPRASFLPLRELTDSEDPTKGRPLGSGVQVVAVQTERDEEPITSGRAYIYFWPGGLTERSTIQLQRTDGADSGLTVLISSLTGRASIERGRIELPAVREDVPGDGFSERQE